MTRVGLTWSILRISARGLYMLVNTMRGPAEHAVFQGHALVHGNVVLNLTVFADTHIRADDHVLADVAVFTDSRTGENVGKMPDFGFVADVGIPGR